MGVVSYLDLLDVLKRILDKHERVNAA
jgi:hypothetical protein